MPGLETIIRPFVGVDTTPVRDLAQPPQQAANVVLQIGKSGSGKSFSGSYSHSVTYYMTKQEEEVTTS